MALVSYSDSETDEAVSTVLDPDSRLEQNKLKRKRDSASTGSKNQPSDGDGDLPPLPSCFHDLYTTPSRVSTRDDPSLHGGRKRIVPHVEGNWATHVYLEWNPNRSEFEVLSQILSIIQHDSSPTTFRVHSLLCSELGAQLPLHISLSRPIVLVTEQRERFKDLLKRSNNSSGLRPFTVTLTALDWVANQEQTRWFLVLRLAKPANDGLNCLLRIVNEAALVLGQAPLYADPAAPTQRGSRNSIRGRGASERRDVRARSLTSSLRAQMPRQERADFSDCFHVSIAWALEKPSQKMLAQTQSLNEDSVMSKRLAELRLGFDSVKVKIGNVVHDLPLPTKAEEGKGLIGTL